jgi:excisionase family DNA binding protein
MGARRVAAVIDAARVIISEPEGPEETAALACALASLITECMLSPPMWSQAKPKIATAAGLLTIAAAAGRLGIAAYTAYQLARRGELETVRVGRRVLVPEEGIARFIEARTHGVCSRETAQVRGGLPGPMGQTPVADVPAHRRRCRGRTA